MRTSLILSILIFLAFKGFGQTRYDVQVQKPGKELMMPWTGGFNAPQFANIDFNRDGITDLISFDRQGDILRTYIHLPASGRWAQAWQYEVFFPELTDWVQIVDFDKDGVEDLFTSSSATGIPGVTVYKGHYENEIWSFTKLRDRGRDYLQIPTSNILTNLYVSWDDIPSITDVDSDGDVDVLSFEPGGTYIAYYKNHSVELGWGSDSLRFELEDLCWGKILENELTEEVYLSDDPDICSDGDFLSEDPIVPRHSGSTVATIDVDFDGDLDAWLGDITSSHLVFLLNGLNKEHAWITSQEPRFPADDVEVDIPFFVAAYFVELDDDPEKELLAAVNSRSLAEDRMSVWRYDDDIADGPLKYKLTEKGWLQNEMIDVGSHSRPAIADINGDELKDLIIGGYHYTSGSQTRIPSLWYFRNIGTLTQPYFQFVTDDYLALSEFAELLFDFAPAFGDLDGNGSIDLLIGEQNGKLIYFQNNAPAGDSMIFGNPVYPYMNIGVGVSSTPQIVDINGDGLSDLVVGERTGNSDVNGRCSNMNYFQNIGTPSSPVFNPDPTTSPNTACFGRVLFDFPLGLPQYSTPNIVRAKTGLILLTGSDAGDLRLYTDLQDGITGAATLITENYGGLDFGNRSAPALADLNNDGKFELLAGNLRGGLELFNTDFEVGTTSIVENDPVEKPYLVLTSGDRIEIKWNDVAGESSLVDLFGRELDHAATEGNQVFQKNKFPSGIYFIRLSLGDKVWVEKVTF